MGKRYNPFKMWGAYLGLVLGVVILSLHIGNLMPDFWCTPFIVGKICSSAIIYIFSPIAGFILGWIIHSIIRLVRR